MTQQRNWASAALVGITLALALLGCGRVGARSEPATYPQQRAPSSNTLFDDAIKKAAVYDSSSVHQLQTIQATEAKVKVVTWTDWSKYDLGKQQLKIDLWVTKVPEVQNICSTFTREVLQLRLQQLLGLPTTKNCDRFVVMEVERTNIFRPCANPEPSLPTCTAELPKDASTEHKAWLGTQLFKSYKSPDGFPWTRLGYTFDWNPDSKDRYGASEFIVKKDAEVDVKEIVPTAEYCARAENSPRASN